MSFSESYWAHQVSKFYSRSMINLVLIPNNLLYFFFKFDGLKISASISEFIYNIDLISLILQQLNFVYSPYKPKNPLWSCQYGISINYGKQPLAEM